MPDTIYILSSSLEFNSHKNYTNISTVEVLANFKIPTIQIIHLLLGKQINFTKNSLVHHYVLG